MRFLLLTLIAITSAKGAVIQLSSTGPVTHVFTPATDRIGATAYDYVYFTGNSGQSITASNNGQLEVRLSDLLGREFSVNGDINEFSLHLSIHWSIETSIYNMAVTFNGLEGFPAGMFSGNANIDHVNHIIDYYGNYPGPPTDPFSFLGLTVTANVTTAGQTSLYVDSGYIRVGRNNITDGKDIGTVLTVPEPAAPAASLAAIGLLCLRRRKRA